MLWTTQTDLVSRVDCAEECHAHETRATTFSADHGVGSRHRSGQKAPHVPLGPLIGPVAEREVEDDFGSSCRAGSDHLPAEHSIDVSIRLQQKNFEDSHTLLSSMWRGCMVYLPGVGIFIPNTQVFHQLVHGKLLLLP